MTDPWIVSNDNGDYYVPVDMHTDATRLYAANEVAGQVEGYCAADGPASARAVAALAATAVAVDFTQHTTDPGDNSTCDCEAVGWWCDSQPDTEHTRSFWAFEYGDIEELRPLVEDEVTS